MPEQLTVTKKVHFASATRGKRHLQAGPKPAPRIGTGRVPRISRLMALAIKFDGLLKSGAVRDQAELAELGHVSRPRVTQIMNLLYLAPDIQEEILFLPRVASGRDPISEHDVRPIAAIVGWDEQRLKWKSLIQRCPIER